MSEFEINKNMRKATNLNIEIVLWVNVNLQWREMIASVLCETTLHRHLEVKQTAGSTC